MTPATALQLIVRPTLTWLGAPYPGGQREVLMLAIAMQESRFATRDQSDDDKPDDADHQLGPALGWWQFESSGGVRGVMRHRTTAATAQWVLAELCIPAETPRAVWRVLQWSEVTAAAWAAMLIRTIPKPLPALGDEAEAWQQYVDTWRPGKPHPRTWGRCYAAALDAVQASALVA